MTRLQRNTKTNMSNTLDFQLRPGVTRNFYKKSDVKINPASKGLEALKSRNVNVTLTSAKSYKFFVENRKSKQKLSSVIAFSPKINCGLSLEINDGNFISGVRCY